MIRLSFLPPLLAFFLLAGCAPTASKSTISTSSAATSIASSSATSAAVTFDALPPQRSLDTLGTMTLRGTGLILEDVLADNSIYTRYRIAYESNGLRISGILNIPKSDGPFPLLMLNHGYIDPKVYTNGRGLKREQDYLARRGFAVLHSDYRGHAESDPSPDESEVYDAGMEYSMDVLNAINAMRQAAIPGIDTERIGMLGHSMGGGITLNILVTHPDLVNAAVLYAPVHGDAWENFFRWRAKRPEADQTMIVLGTRKTQPTSWDAISSITRLDRIVAPVLIAHGNRDKDVPKSWSDDLRDRLTAGGKDVTYIEYAAEGHEFAGSWNDFMEQTAEFFERHLL